MNARGIQTAAFQVLHLLSCTRWGTVGVPPAPARSDGGRWGGGGGVIRGVVPPIRIPPPVDGHVWWGVPKVGYPLPPGQGTPSQVWRGDPLARSDRGVPGVGYPSGWGTPPYLDLVGVPPSPRCGQTDGWMDGQTRVKTLPSRRTTYAVRNKSYVASVITALKLTLGVNGALSWNVHVICGFREGKLRKTPVVGWWCFIGPVARLATKHFGKQ